MSITPEDDGIIGELASLLLDVKQNESKQAYAAIMMGVYDALTEATGAPDPELQSIIADLAIEAWREDADELERQMTVMANIREEQQRQRSAELSAQRADYYIPGWTRYQIEMMPHLMIPYGHRK